MGIIFCNLTGGLIIFAKAPSLIAFAAVARGFVVVHHLHDDTVTSIQQGALGAVHLDIGVCALVNEQRIFAFYYGAPGNSQCCLPEKPRIDLDPRN
jgi:hypothetical protein